MAKSFFDKILDEISKEIPEQINLKDIKDFKSHDFKHIKFDDFRNLKKNGRKSLDEINKEEDEQIENTLSEEFIHKEKSKKNKDKYETSFRTDEEAYNYSSMKAEKAYSRKKDTESLKNNSSIKIENMKIKKSELKKMIIFSELLSKPKAKR